MRQVIGMVKKINLFVIESSAEEEEWKWYYDGKGSAEQFEKDVREILIKILNEKFAWTRIDDLTYITKRANGVGAVRKFIDFMRNEKMYDSILFVDYEADETLIYYAPQMEAAYRVNVGREFTEKYGVIAYEDL